MQTTSFMLIGAYLLQQFSSALIVIYNDVFDDSLQVIVRSSARARRKFRFVPNLP